jgi:hypothetical protein
MDYKLSPTQAAWIEPMRESYRGDPRRSDFCDGCELFGLCIWHAALDEGRVKRKVGGGIIKR